MSGGRRLEVIMVRHAHADWIPDESRPLSARGARDAQRVARLLATVEIEAIYSSPYRRAIQTVEPLAEATGLEIRVVDELHERILADGPVDDFERALAESWADFDFAFATGESHRQTLERFSHAFRDVVSRHARGTIAIGTHGNVLGLLLHEFDPAYGYEFWSAMTWPDVYRLRVLDERIVEVERLWDDGAA